MYRNVVGLIECGVPFAEQARLMKEVGWEGAFFCWDENSDNAAIAGCIKDAGLFLQSVHAPFGKMDRIWEAEEEGLAEQENLIGTVRGAAALGAGLVVMHAVIGMERIEPSARDRERGLVRFGRIFDAAEEAGVVVAVENTEGEGYLDAVLAEYGHRKNVKFCIDTGHEMCYNRSRDMIGRYKDNLYCTHLNDNLGMSGDKITWTDDLHLLPFDGVADWAGIARRLKNAHYRGDFTYELNLFSKPGRHENDAYRAMPFKDYISLAYARARKFRGLFDETNG